MLSGHCIYKNWHVYTQKIKVLFIVMRALYCKIFYLLKNTIFIIWHLKINTEFKNNKNHSCRNSLKKFHTTLFIIVWRCSPIIRRSLHQWWHPVFVFAYAPNSLCTLLSSQPWSRSTKKKWRQLFFKALWLGSSNNTISHLNMGSFLQLQEVGCYFPNVTGHWSPTYFWQLDTLSSQIPATLCLYG